MFKNIFPNHEQLEDKIRDLYKGSPQQTNEIFIKTRYSRTNSKKAPRY